MSSIAFRVALSETRAPLNLQSKPVPAYIFSIHAHSRDDDDSWHSKAKLSLQKSLIMHTEYKLHSQSLETSAQLFDIHSATVVA